ncbi:MAG: RNase adapter RapZ [Candidatus Riflebacteria bacterium]|nr:RNase adapter RapZ [Candidatus Riflebacteria bacterium]
MCHLLTGLSGAGKSLVSNYLEDQGFYCVDNLPPELIEKFIELTMESERRYQQLLLVCDVRSGDQFRTLFEVLDSLPTKGIRPSIIFLEASKEILVRRFSETRRRHPLNYGSLPENIERERAMLADLRERADILLDTSNFSVAQLKKRIMSLLNRKLPRGKMGLVFSSFGYKYGIPVESDLVFDVRFLPNPHYVRDLAPLNGCDAVVQEYIFKYAISKRFVHQLVGFLKFLIPQYLNEGKTQLTVSVGCTGGQHRSVAVVEKLAETFSSRSLSVIKAHRDLARLTGGVQG